MDSDVVIEAEVRLFDGEAVRVAQAKFDGCQIHFLNADEVGSWDCRLDDADLRSQLDDPQNDLLRVRMEIRRRGPTSEVTMPIVRGLAFEFRQEDRVAGHGIVTKVITDT